MQIIITIKEVTGGDISVHVKEAANMATVREGKYADAITKSIKRHIVLAIPDIARQIKKEEGN
jgi:hypothetical protein